MLIYSQFGVLVYFKRYILIGKIQILAWRGLAFLYAHNGTFNTHDLPINEIVQLGVSTLHKNDVRLLRDSYDECSAQNACLKAFSYIIHDEIIQSETWKHLKSSKEERIRISQVKGKSSSQIL